MNWTGIVFVDATPTNPIRLWAGCTLQKDQDRAMSLWIRVCHERQPNEISVPRGIRVRALSCLANSQWELKQLPDDEPDVWNIDSVWRAGAFADDCASLGFISPVVLMIGTGIQDLMSIPEIPEARHPRFQEFVFLWEVVERRNREYDEEKKKRDGKVAKAPNAYICAAQGCGIEGTRKSGLLRCAGKCPSNIKPSYCSKECQKAVRGLSSHCLG